MAKRFTDTLKWDDEWFLTLSHDQKLFWIYLCDKCDHAGIWKVSPTAVKMYLGDSINLDEFLELAGQRIEALGDGHWHLSDFCAFQYGPLDERNSAHKGALKILRFHGIEPPLTLPIGGLVPSKDKDTDKDEVKVKNSYTEDFEKFWKLYPAREGKKAGKLDAAHEWAKLDAPARELCLKAVTGLKDEKLPLDACRWLKRGRYNDEVDLAPAAPLKGAAACASFGHPGYGPSYDKSTGATIRACVRCGVAAIMEQK